MDIHEPMQSSNTMPYPAWYTRVWMLGTTMLTALLPLETRVKVAIAPFGSQMTRLYKVSAHEN